MFPLVEPHADITFVTAFSEDIEQGVPFVALPVFPGDVVPLFPSGTASFPIGFPRPCFLSLGVALAIVTARTVKSLVESNAPVGVEVLIALAGLVTCAVQFYLGKRIGTRYSDRISAGQALGQKKHCTCHPDGLYLSGPAFIGRPGSYVLWQNLFNSYQLWKKRKNDPI